MSRTNFFALHRMHRVSATTGIILGLAVSAGAQAVPRVTTEVKDSALVTLKGNTLPVATSLNDRGRLPDDTPTGRVLMVLKHSDEQQAALDKLVSAQATAGSPQFHKWITPAQYAAQFGVADADIQTVTTYLSNHGFNIAQVYPNKMAIEFSGTAGQMRSTFKTELHTFAVNGKTFTANDRDPQIPAALSSVITGFASLNNYHPTSKLSAPATRETALLKHTTAHPDFSNFTTSTLDVSPGDIAKIYNIPTSATGAGVSIGVVNSTNVNITYLNNYQKTFDLTVKNPTVVVDGDDPGETQNESDALAQLELLSAVAPSANLYLYSSSDLFAAYGLNFAFIRAVNDNQVQVLVIDSENCEANLGADGNAFINFETEQASAQGITVIAGAGNGGSDSCQALFGYGNTGAVAAVSTGLSVNGYASTPFVTAVGATDFYYPVAYPDPSEALVYWNSTNSGVAGYTSAKGYIPEQPLNLSDGTTNYYGSSGVALASGGGISTLGLGTSGYVQPSWQIPVVAGSYDPAIATAIGRVVPDVSIFGGDGSNASTYMLCLQADECVNSSPTAITYESFAGTNTSSATFAGVAALVVQAHGAQGNINPVLYSLYQSTSGNSIFHAPAAGTNAVACVAGSPDCGAAGYLVESPSGPLAYRATTIGYSAAEGLGSVNVANLISDWATPAKTTTTTTLSLTAAGTPTPVTSFVHGTTLQTNVTVAGGTGTPTGDVAIITNSPLASNAGVTFFPLTNGIVNDTTRSSALPGGTYQVYARYAGDGATYLPSISSPLTVTVTPETSRVELQNASFTSGSTVPYGTSISVQAFIGSATNGASLGEPTGSVTITDRNSTGATTSTIAPVNAANVATFTSLLATGTHTLSFAYSGDASYQPSTAPSTLTVTVTAQATSTFLTSTSTSDPKTGSTQLVAIVSPTSGATKGVGPAGTVTFTTSGKTVKTLGTATLVTGQNSGGYLAGFAYLQLAGSKITAANSTIIATFNPAATSSYAGSVSSPITLSTAASGGTTASTTAIVTADGYASYFDYSGSVAFNVTVSGTGSTPTGTVSLFSNGIALGSATLSGGTGTVTITNDPSTGYLPAPLSIGKNIITAQYSGDATFAASAKETTISILDEGDLPDFALQSNINYGILSPTSTSAAFTLQLTSINNFAAQGYTLTFKSALPTGITCSFANTTAKFSTTANTLTNTVTCAGAAGYTVASVEPVQKPLNRFWIASGSAAFACVFLLGIPARRKGWQAMLGAIMLAVLVLGGSAALTACGGNAMSSKAATAAVETTSDAKAAATKTLAKGNYQVLVTVSSPFATGLNTTTTATTQLHTIPLTISVQ